MGNPLSGFVVAVVVVQIVILSASSPAAAISADLAKKCRDMAIKAHPPTVAGTSPYAAAERNYFHTCVSKNGNMSDSNSDSNKEKDQPAQSSQ